MNELTLIIPAKNEAESLPKVIDELKPYNYKIYIVLDKADVKTIEAIKNYDIEIIFQGNKGYGDALIEGIKKCKTDLFCIFNADGSFDPKYLDQMLKKNEDNFEFVFSTRYKKPGGSDDDTFLTFIGNYFFTFLCKILFRLNISDVLYTYVMGKTTAFQDLALKYNDFTFCIELPIKAKFKSLRMFDFPSYERPRISGKKKVNELRDGFLILISILRLFIFKK